ncbi:kinase-like protein [Hyphopichia burtonii NRRL Y-1933]|uniref:non-specific serine/threonine protein kinase n=1 Tax=Hyphopichia burtonii NRRL Y-1933 TaxID=984485 RepID=A0A1E4RPK8_9ASCO|nr:kinase-like protein [Hyphopichia burtonii NRRL Y-1933]ODV69203.1 kinase-like protein [Hyphopichia burtonii NRRL Y-1933]
MNLEESISEYQPGGYHPVHLNDIYTSNLTAYKIIQKLGWGHFATVWLAKNLKTNQFVAIKIVKSSHNYFEAAEDEIKILSILNHDSNDDHHINDSIYNLGKNGVMKLLDHFIISGSNGNHIAIVFEILGENILSVIYKYKKEKLNQLSFSTNSIISNPSLIPINIIKDITKQILLSINYMHHRGIIHTDLKPENILIQYKGLINNKSSFKSTNFLLPLIPLNSKLDDSTTIKIADLGNATYSNLHFTNQIQTRQYRSPEILLKYKSWGASTDLWSIGCLLFELITGDYLFDPHDGINFDKDEDHLAQIIELLGEFPSINYLKDCKLSSKYFNINSKKNEISLKNIKTLKFWKLYDVFIDKYKFDPNDINIKLITDLILKCLRFNLDERYDCKSLLAHPWFDTNPTYNEDILKHLPNIHDDIPGYTSTWDMDD